MKIKTGTKIGQEKQSLSKKSNRKGKNKMGNVVYAKDAVGKIKETAIIERIFDLEEVKKFKIQIAADKKKTQEDFNKRMTMINNEEKKIAFRNSKIMIQSEANTKLYQHRRFQYTKSNNQTARINGIF